MHGINKTISYNGHQLALKDLTLLHPEYGGNKWFKLKYNLLEALEEGHQAVLTFGGYWSNHIYSCAAACADKGIGSIGIIRGQKPDKFSATLKFAESKGMKLHFISRAEYKTKDSPEFLDAMKQKFGSFYLIPQGGSNNWGVHGCKEILDENDGEFDTVYCACGNGATLAGIILSLKPDQRAVGVAVMKGSFMKEEVMKHLSSYLKSEQKAELFKDKFDVRYDCHFGGFSKATSELLDFVRDFKSQTGVQLDPVYTGKMMWSALQHDQSEIKTRILTIHTGGLQGIKGFGL